mmetsp:Transcript_134683/g.348958  ORF Transcript_134683/g.348958 Transcript_134683/m.348958 type:complete len:226 (+) Transcript_134683:505-1182(+)
MVVAPMICKSPRDKAGFKMFAASMAPPPPSPPAPTRVWISSIMRMTLPLSRISWMMFFKRSSNSPRYLVPERSVPRSSSMMRLSSNISGTSPSTMRRARPSAMAVLPTPGSPMSTGLFFCLRARIWMARSISSVLPTSGSISPSAAACVRSLPNSSSAAWPPEAFDDEALEAPPVDSWLLLLFSAPMTSCNCLVISDGIASTSTFIFSKTLATLPSFSRKMDKRM